MQDNAPKINMAAGLLVKIPFLKRFFDSHTKEIVSFASVSFPMRVASAGLAFVFNVMMSRIIGAEGTGQYFLAVMVTAIATVFGRVGLDDALVRFISGGMAVNNLSEVKGVYRIAMALAFGSSAISAFIMFISAPLLSTAVFGKPELTGLIRWMSLAVIPTSFLVLHAEALKGLKRISDYMLVQFVGLTGLLVVGVYFTGNIWGIKGVIWTYIAASVLLAILGRFLWTRAMPELKHVSGYFETKKLTDSSIPLFFTTLMSVLMTWSTTFILGIFRTTSEVGVFFVAFRTTLIITLVLFSVNTIAAPKFSELFRKGDMKALGKTARNSTMMMALYALPITLILLVAPGRIMGLFGEGFREGATALRILAVGQFVNVAAGAVGSLLVMTGNERAFRNNTVFMLIVSLVLSIVLIPSYGITGAALSSSVSIILNNISASLLVYKHLSIKIWEIDFRKEKAYDYKL